MYRTQQFLYSFNYFTIFDGNTRVKNKKLNVNKIDSNFAIFNTNKINKIRYYFDEKIFIF